MLYTLRFFSLRNAVCFIMLTSLVSVLFTFYIQNVLKLKQNNSGAKGLTYGTEIMFTTFREGVIQQWHGSRMKLVRVFTF